MREQGTCKQRTAQWLLALLAIPQNGLELSSPLNSRSQTTVGVESSQYFRSQENFYRPGAEEQTASLQLGLTWERQRGPWTGALNLRDDYSATEDFHYVKPYQAFLGWRSERTEVSLGRKLYVWSELDDFWRLGTWQPRFLDDPFERSVGGLTGLFVQQQFGSQSLTFFATGIYQPDLGPNFGLEEQRFVSRSPWFKPPTSVVNLSGVPTDVRYQFEQPEIGDIIWQPAAALQWQWRSPRYYFARLSAAYKPMNQMFFGFPLKFHLEDPKYAAIDVQLRVLYEQVLTMEAGVQDPQGWQAWASLSHDRPLRDETPAEWTTQETSEALIGGLFLGRSWGGKGTSATRAYLSYLRVEGGFAMDRGEFTGEKSLFNRRFYFDEAIQIGLHQGFSIWGYRFPSQIKSQITYDFAQHGVMGELALEQGLGSRWKLTAGLDVIGLVDQSGRIQDGLMANFRANDRWSMGVRYVF